MELQLYMSISNSLLDVILNEGNIDEQGVSQGWPQACIIKTSFKQILWNASIWINYFKRTTA